MIPPTIHNDFMDYFPNNEDYPHYGAVSEILPLGELWSYVSSSLLNGLFNGCGQVIKAYVLGRYESENAIIEKPPQHRIGSEWHNTASMTKSSLIDLMIQPGRQFHANIGMFEDDVIVLKRALGEGFSTDSTALYWFFWFDQDVSDCCIGRFTTEDSETEVIRKFGEWVATHPESTLHKPN